MTVSNFPASLMDRLDDSCSLKRIKPWGTEPSKEGFSLLSGEQDLTTGLANVLKDLKGCFEEANVPDWQDKFDLAKVTRTLGQLSTTSITSRVLIRNTLQEQDE